MYQTIFQPSLSLSLLVCLVSASAQCSFKNKRLKEDLLTSKHLDVLQDLRVLTKAGWSPRALRHLFLSMVLSCTPPEDYTYRRLQQCSCTPAFMVHSIGQLKILSKVPLISQVTSKAQLPRNACEELSTRSLPPNMPSRSEEQRRRKGGLQNSS